MPVDSHRRLVQIRQVAESWSDLITLFCPQITRLGANQNPDIRSSLAAPKLPARDSFAFLFLVIIRVFGGQTDCGPSYLHARPDFAYWFPISEPFSSREWSRVADSARRQVKQITGKDCDIGIGRKFRSGRPYGWQVAIRVYLPRKRKQVAESKLIPSHFQIRLKRGKRFVLLKIRSDVDSRSDFRPTASVVRLGSRRFAAGALLRWLEDAEICWGFLTVAHEFDGTSRTFAAVRASSTQVFDCRLLDVAPENRNLDAAIMQIKGQPQEIVDDLIDAGLIDDPNPPPVSLQRVSAVKTAAIEHRSGRTYPPGASWRFKGEEVFPNGFLLGNRRLDDCIRVGQSQHGVFKAGTSGSMWKFGRRVSCLQAGGRRPNFEDGIGQPYSKIMKWVRQKLGRGAAIVSVF